MFLWIFSRYSKQPFYRAVPDGCLSTNWTKIIWIWNHAFCAARQRVLYMIVQSIFEIRFIGRILWIRLNLPVLLSVRNTLFSEFKPEKVKSCLKIKLLDLTENQVLRIVWKSSEIKVLAVLYLFVETTYLRKLWF